MRTIVVEHDTRQVGCVLLNAQLTRNDTGRLRDLISHLMPGKLTGFTLKSSTPSGEAIMVRLTDRASLHNRNEAHDFILQIIGD